jgi:preprotein translocase SecE subunit
MEKQSINKAVTFGFASAGILIWWVSGVIFETLAAGIPFMARLRVYKVSGVELYQVGLPFLVGFGLFLYLQLSAKKRQWAEEVVTETSKVAWPSQKDIQVSTLVVSFMLVISGIILFGMDALSSNVIDFILGR